MKFKLRVMALAAVTLVSGGAQAGLETMASGSSSLTFVAYDRVGTVGSFMADLNFSLDQFLTTSAPAQTTTWNFNTNTITVGGVTQTGSTIDWSPFTSFLNTVQTADLRWGVIAGDSVNQRFLTTAQTSGSGSVTAAMLADSTLSSAQGSTTPNMVNVDGLFTSSGVEGTHASVNAGANTSLSAADNSFAGKNGVGFFGQNGNWNNALKWNAVNPNGATSRFFYIDTQSRNAAVNPDLPTIKIFGVGDMQAPTTLPAGVIDQDIYSTFSYDQGTGTLTWQAAVVPEPGTYAMLLAGLAAIGFIARRRSA